MACLLGYVGPDDDWEARLNRVLPDAAWHERGGGRGPNGGLWWSGPAGGGFVRECPERVVGAVGAWLDSNALIRNIECNAASASDIAHCAIVLDRQGARLVRDPVGTIPLYVREMGDAALVGTSALALARIEPRSGFDWAGVSEFLTFGQLFGTRTLYDGVQAVPAGETWRVGPEGRREARVGSLPDWRNPSAAADERAESVDASLRRSVSLIAPNGREGVFLSGGLDSRYVASLLNDASRTFRAYTFGAETSADMRGARRIAERLGLDHVSACTEPRALARSLRDAVRACDGMVAATHLHGSELLPRIRDECSVVWNGFAGDAILGGSFSHRRYNRTDDLADTLYRALRGPGLNTDICSVLTMDVRHHPREAITAALGGVGEAEPQVRAYRFLIRERVGRLASVGLSVDRHFLPVACPFANRPVLETSFLLSDAERRGSSLLRRALTRNHRAAARERWPRTGLPPAAPAWADLAGRAVQRLLSRDQTLDYASLMKNEWSQCRSDTIGRLADVDGFDADAVARASRTPASPERLSADAALMSLGIVAEALGD